MDTETKIIGRCPVCGGNVVKTCKGYRCENNIAEQPTCVLNINGIIGNRKMSDEEITELLEHRFILLDGFASKEGKAFPSVLELADSGYQHDNHFHSRFHIFTIWSLSGERPRRLR